MENLEPTLVHESGGGTAPGSTSSDVSRAQVGLIEGRRQAFADETAQLLRSRLKAAALALGVLLAVAFLANLVTSAPLIGVRALVLVVILVALFALHSRLDLSLAQLRLCETAIFAAVIGQLLLMMYARVSSFATDGDVVSAVAARHLFHGAFSLVIFTYGIFIPNTWKRALAVLLPIACLPYLLVYVLRWSVPAVGDALDADNSKSPVPLPFVAALVAAFGTHIINAVRREAFKARQFGQYHLKEKLGSGGMGEVYKAEHRMLKRPCALKLIRAESEADAQAIVRFEQEVRSTAKLSHWNTVEIFDYGRTDDGTFYYVMELLPGLSLDDLVKRYGPLPPERTVHFLVQTCRALREAHGMGLIHRDIKPANIFAACRGGIYDVAKLLDFGLVRQTTGISTDNQRADSTSGFSGSPLYMAPEQAEAYENVDAGCDIYSLGAVAYYLLTGRPPFAGKSPVEILMAHAHRDVVPPRKVEPSVPADLEQVVMRCLEKDPKKRFQHAAALERALTACACAGKWTDQNAESWWTEHQPERIHSARTATAGPDPAESRSDADETIDVNSPDVLKG